MNSKIVLILVLISTSLFAQGGGALWYLNIQPSTLHRGAGDIGVSDLETTSSGYYYNPAKLGMTAKENHISFLTAPDQNWFGNNQWDDFVSYYNYGFNVGYNLESNYNVPVSIGIAYLNSKISFGDRIIRDEFDNILSIEKDDSFDKFDALSIGIGFEYWIQLNIGLSYKNAESQLGPKTSEYNRHVEVTAIDYGVLINAPISKLFPKCATVELDKNSVLKPRSNFSVGLSLQNYGDEISYLKNKSQKDPISRISRLGYTFNLGFDLVKNSKSINLFNYSFSAEAEDGLIKDRLSFMDKIEYQSPFSDLRFSDNLIKLKGDENISVHKGHILSFLETFKILTGRYSGFGFTESIKCSGYAVSSKGMFKVVDLLVENSMIKYISEHLEFNYYWAETDIPRIFEIERKSFDITYKGFIF